VKQNILNVFREECSEFYSEQDCESGTSPYRAVKNALNSIFKKHPATDRNIDRVKRVLDHHAILIKNESN